MRSGSASATAFIDVAVIPMDSERVLTQQTVVVQNGWITALGPVGQVQVPAGVIRIDGHGKFLMPGLADMHAHLQLYDSATAEHILFMLLANGVTTIRNVDYIPFPLISGSTKFSLMSGKTVLQFRTRIAAGELLGPRIYTSGYWCGVDYDQNIMIDHLPSLKNQEEVDRLVESYKAAGYDFIKVHDEDAALYSYLVNAAHKVGMPFMGHVIRGVSLEQTFAAHQLSIEHLDGYKNRLKDQSSNISALVEATKLAGVWNCPTMLLNALNDGQISHATMAQWPEERYMSATTHGIQDSMVMREKLDPPNAVDASRLLTAQRHLVKALQDSGAGLLLGTDEPAVAGGIVAGFAVHRELEALVQAGLTPYQALATGTRNVAIYFGTLGESGTVTVGKRANLILLDGNPFEDIRNTARRSGVMLNGRWLRQADLDRHIANYVGTINVEQFH
jgi:imidazolonepropionase-like amidohydrolase